MNAENWGEIGDFDQTTIDATGAAVGGQELKLIGHADGSRTTVTPTLLQGFPKLSIQCSTGLVGKFQFDFIKYNLFLLNIRFLKIQRFISSKRIAATCLFISRSFVNFCHLLI